MSPLGAPTRGTPTTRTPDSGVVRIASEGRASRAVARALGQLVDRLLLLGPDANGVIGGLAGANPSDPKVIAVRDALRQLAARSREGALLCRVVNDVLVLEGVPIDRLSSADDAFLRLLLTRLIVLNVGSLTVREGAAPGELLTLGRLLAQPSVPVDPRRTPATPMQGIGSVGSREDFIGSSTPSTVDALQLIPDAPQELLRTWSVLVSPVVPSHVPEGAATVSAGVLARLAAARTDEAAVSAIAGVRELLDDVQRRGDAVALEGIARACLTQLNAVGDQGGRLALEGVLRTMQRAPLLELLAQRFPHSTDRPLLLPLFARAGDAGVAMLVQQLLTTDDALSRRAYFDGIVALDVGSSHLFAALSDSRWYVVRNAAALLGEMSVEHADDALLPLLRHTDERIRIAVARALMRLRTVKSMQALHSVIDDTNPEVRRLSAAAFGLSGATAGSGVRPPAARLSTALERETDEDVALEMLAALGRLGSADAIQRLLRLALPPTSDLTGTAVPEVRDAWVRIAALDALVRARGYQMMPVIESLMTDADPEVAAAAVALRPLAAADR